MIFHRRALQQRLTELRAILGDEAIDNLAERLNRVGKDRIAAMWELALFHGFSKCGSLRSEEELPSGRRPDIMFYGRELQITADVTAVSDEGLDQDNPYHELSQLMEAAKKKLGLPIGGLDLRIGHRYETNKRGTKTVLKLPPKKKLREFVEKKVLPILREQAAVGQLPLRVVIDDEDVGIVITIDPSKSPYSSAGFAAYNVPTIKDRNPLYRALKGKADQLRGAPGLTGVIVGDADCAALSGRSHGSGGLAAETIVQEFFRQHLSVDFVVLLSVRERGRSWVNVIPAERENHLSIFVRDGCSSASQLKALFDEVSQHFPTPAMMPVNGASRAREEGYDLGHHGGYKTTGLNMVRIGLREFTEVLAGLRTLQDNGAKLAPEGGSQLQQHNVPQSVILHNLLTGRLPISLDIIKTDENHNDDWVEIHFGEIDPAIAPLR
jgi:hypothetical protein